MVESSYIPVLVNYCSNPLQYHRRATREVKVGNVGIGGDNPIRVQSMITCDTMDTEASIQQTIELADAGCEIVRITAPTVKDSRNLEHIVKGLRERGWQLALWFSVILNVNLAILNLLPIPVLDGGHIVLALIESVRRKPVNMRVLEVIQTSCAVLIIGYMLYITFFDVQDLPFVRKKLDQLEAQSPGKNSQVP